MASCYNQFLKYSHSALAHYTLLEMMDTVERRLSESQSSEPSIVRTTELSND
jgi:hypothetical protein